MVGHDRQFRLEAIELEHHYRVGRRGATAVSVTLQTQVQRFIDHYGVTETRRGSVGEYSDVH
jgi:hypothetical protein